MKRSLILTALSFLVLAQLGWGQVPQTISHQGVLRDASGDIVDDGDYTLTFKLWSAAEGGTELWSEAQSVPVIDGIFSAVLGVSETFSSTLADFESPLWLEMWIEAGPGVTGPEFLSPRIELTAVPYAIKSRGVAGSTNVFPGSGSVGIGTTTPGVKLKIVSPNADGIMLTDSISGTYRATLLNWETMGGQLNLNDAADGAVKAVIRGYASPDGYQASFTAGNVGIGTDAPAEVLDVTGSIRVTNGVYSSGALLLNSDTAFDIRLNDGNPGNVLIANGGGKVGIGTTSPSQKLDVNGTVLANGFALNNSNTRISSLTTDNIDLITSNAARVRIDPSGDVGIGTINPSAKLDVAGDANIQGNLVALGDVSTQGTLTALGDANIGGAITIPATTRYFSIPAAAFQGGGNVPYIADEDMGMMSYNISASVNLPHGATIKEFLARVYDGYATEDITVSLKYAGAFANAYTDIFMITSNWDYGDGSLESTTLDHTVDNVNNVYAVTASWMSPQAPDYAEIKFRNVRITYTVTNPLP